MNGYERTCQRLDCKKGGLEPEIANGEKTRRVLQEPGLGAKSCSPNGERSLESCTGKCSGKFLYTKDGYSDMREFF